MTSPRYRSGQPVRVILNGASRMGEVVAQLSATEVRTRVGGTSRTVPIADVRAVGL